MAVDIAGVVGEQNMRPDAKDVVIIILAGLKDPATVRRYLYARWARVVGIVPTAADLNRVAIWNDGE